MLKESLTVFAFGGSVYSGIEMLWRGRTHWTMMLLGGLCFLILYYFNKKTQHINLLLRCVLGAVFITLLELITGYIVNIRLGWNVWDYSNLRFNFLGQISLKYFILWFLLCIPVLSLINQISYRFKPSKATG